MALMRGGDFDRAAPALAAFLRRYPGSGYADSARFWLGNALYGKRDYKEAMPTSAPLPPPRRSTRARPRRCWRWPTARPR
jgi:hypothetical protein